MHERGFVVADNEGLNSLRAARNRGRLIVTPPVRQRPSLLRQTQASPILSAGRAINTGASPTENCTTGSATKTQFPGGALSSVDTMWSPSCHPRHDTPSNRQAYQELNIIGHDALMPMMRWSAYWVDLSRYGENANYVRDARAWLAKHRGGLQSKNCVREIRAWAPFLGHGECVRAADMACGRVRALSPLRAILLAFEGPVCRDPCFRARTPGLRARVGARVVFSLASPFSSLTPLPRI
jgi:hypothetical protein